MRLSSHNKTVSIFISMVLVLMLIPLSVARAQTVATVGYTISPSVFPLGQSSSALLCMSPLSTADTLSFSQNDVIGFQFDTSIGSVTNVDPTVLVHSSTLSSTDFQTLQNTANGYKLTITYTNATTKTFTYTDTVCARVTFTSGATVGTTIIKYSSKFTGIAGIVGNLPYLTVSVVDFPTGTPGPKGDKGDKGADGTSPDLTSVLARLSVLESKVGVTSPPSGGSGGSGGNSSALGVSVSGTFHGDANQIFNLQFYFGSNCQNIGTPPNQTGQFIGEVPILLGTIQVQTDAMGDAKYSLSFLVPGTPTGGFVNAQATSLDGNSSKVTACQSVTISSLD